MASVSQDTLTTVSPNTAARETGRARALQLWAGVVGEEQVVDSREVATLERPDVGRHRGRTTVATIRPDTVDQVRHIVRSASECDIPLYPVSTGRNWGMGSRSPAVDGCAVLDLGGIGRIRKLDLEHGYAIVEPGVTQRELAGELEGSGWMLNVTASCADSSVVGNALERGDGTIRSRAHDVLGIEAVLSGGQLITTGGLSGDDVYRGRVAGPDLTQAFAQSNLGIVTAMAVSLVPRPEMIRLVHMRVDRDALGPVVDTIAALLRGGLSTSGLLRLRELWLVPDSPSAFAPPVATPDGFTVTGPLMGTIAEVEVAERIVHRRLGALGCVSSWRSLDVAYVDEDDPLYPRALLARGTPTCKSLHATLGVNSCEEVDRGHVGFLALMPLVPLDRSTVLATLDVLERGVANHFTTIVAEWNLVSAHVANGVMMILFDGHSEDAIARAHALRKTVRQGLIVAGCPPYRSDIDHALDDGSADVAARAIKAALDPSGVIAPGRYV